MWISRGLPRHTVHHRVGTPSEWLWRKEFDIGLDSGYRHRVCDEGRHRGTLRTTKKASTMTLSWRLCVHTLFWAQISIRTWLLGYLGDHALFLSRLCAQFGIAEMAGYL